MKKVQLNLPDEVLALLAVWLDLAKFVKFWEAKILNLLGAIIMQFGPYSLM